VGGLALLQTIWAALQGTFYLSAGVIGLPLGVGLRRRSPAWRKLALCASVVQILVIGLVAYVICRPGEGFADLSADLTDRIGPLLGRVALGALAALMAAVLAISVWSIRLLTRSEVKRVFQPGVNFKGQFGLLAAVALVLFLATIARETGGISLYYFTSSEEDAREEKREEPRWRVVVGDRIVGEGNNSLAIPDFEVPCLIEIQGMGEAWFGVATTFNVQRHFDAGSGSTETHEEWKTYSVRAAAQLSPSLRNSSDRIIVEVDQPQLSGGYWWPLYKHFTAEYRARIHGEGKYATYQDQMNERRDVTVSGPCSVHDLKEHLLKRTKDTAMNKIMNRAEQTAKNATWLMSEGTKASRAKEYDRAIAIFSKALRLDPKDAHALRERGDAWSANKEYHEAIKDYDEAIRLDPEHSRAENDSWAKYDKQLALNNRGWAWYKKKDYDRAIQDFDEAIALDPEFTRAFRNRAEVWSDKKDYERAIKDYDEAIRLEPKYVDTFNDRGLAWGHRKEYDKAIKDFDEAIRLEPKFTIAFNNRGNAWRDKQDYDKAIQDYDEAIRLEPKYTIAIYNRGLTWSFKKDYDKAKNDYNQVSQQCDEAIREGQRSPYNVLIGHVAATQAGDEAAAERFLKDSVGKLEETWPYPVVQFLCGEIDETALLKLSTDDGKRTDARCVLGMRHAIQGRKDQALAHFRWVKQHGSTTYMTYTIAVAELERLERTTEGPKR
jgi:tetratricopeptide (TPR) repeat protein